MYLRRGVHERVVRMTMRVQERSARPVEVIQRAPCSLFTGLTKPTMDFYKAVDKAVGIELKNAMARNVQRLMREAAAEDAELEGELMRCKEEEEERENTP